VVIAVNTRFLLDQLEGYGYFIHELFKILVTKHPEHRFYFFFDRPFNQQYIYSSNVTPLVISPPARHPILWKYWYDVKIPIALKKIKADVFISPDGYCSLSTGISQCLIIHDLGFLHYPEAYKKSHIRYFKSNTSKFLDKAETVVTVSKFSKDDILSHYAVPASKIHVIYNGVKEVFHPISFDEKTSIKQKYTNSTEYFFYSGAVQPRKNLVNLLKAFSVFKKRLQSSMKLVICGRLAWKNEEFLQLINTYKYRSDIVLSRYVPEKELSLLMGAAYALVYPSLFEGFGVPVVEAMKSGVPVLTSEGTAMQEIAGDAALYFDPMDYMDIADKMMLIYKDEKLRNQLIAAGSTMSTNYDWNQSADKLWDIILRTVKK